MSDTVPGSVLALGNRVVTKQHGLCPGQAPGAQGTSQMTIKDRGDTCCKQETLGSETLTEGI